MRSPRLPPQKPAGGYAESCAKSESKEGTNVCLKACFRYMKR